MDLTNKLWGFCNKLRHDGVDAADYIEQLTYLLFLKMADEKGVKVPKNYDWKSLITAEKKNLLVQLEAILQKLKKKKGILGDIFSEPVSRVRNVEILKALIDEINSINWSDIDDDIVGLAFEELIGKVANEGKKGAGQYFTPRPLIQTIVNVMKPNPLEKRDFRISDVAVGTAGFLVVAYEWLKQQIKFVKTNKSTRNRILNTTYFGQELVQRPRRLALMNMFLHGINANIKLADTIYDKSNDQTFHCILTNPPFGNKGASQIPIRDFPVKTSDKQLNFIQHIIEVLSPGGRAAIVLPDSCLSSEHAKKIWMHFLSKENAKTNTINLHTILKLPEGVFAAYANGIKACVIFIQKGTETNELWIYDARKETQKITTKSNRLSTEHFSDFEKQFGDSPLGQSIRKETDRFKRYSIKEIQNKNYDISFVEIYKPEPLRHPVAIIDEMIKDYENKIIALKELKDKLPHISNGNSKTLDQTSSSRTSSFKKREKASKAIAK